MWPKLPIIVIYIYDLNIYYYINNLVTRFVLFVSNCTQLHWIVGPGCWPTHLTQVVGPWSRLFARVFVPGC